MATGSVRAMIRKQHHDTLVFIQRLTGSHHHLDKHAQPQVLYHEALAGQRAAFANVRRNRIILIKELAACLGASSLMHNS
eukprot:359260-Chlamydomonas_euryale.AAC.6